MLPWLLSFNVRDKMAIGFTGTGLCASGVGVYFFHFIKSKEAGDYFSNKMKKIKVL